MRSANIQGFMLGFTNSIMFYAIAAAFVLGGYLSEEKMFGVDFEKIMIVFSCIIFGAQSVGQAASLTPDYTKAKVAIINIFRLFDRVPKIDNWNTNGGFKPENLVPEIELNSIDFFYPNRPGVQVLNKISLKIKPGQKIALVGSSGCGKSTVTQLLERFYDATSGDLKIGNFNIRELNLSWLRSQVSIVSQEPILFDTSIAENIAYGDNSRQVTKNEIISAAKLANIHDFIISLPMVFF